MASEWDGRIVFCGRQRMIEWVSESVKNGDWNAEEQGGRDIKKFWISQRSNLAL